MAGGDVAALIPGPVGIDDLYLLTQPEDQPPTGSLPVPYSGFVIPDDVLNGTAKQHSQAGPDTIDFQALAAADSGVGVVSGGLVSPAGGLLLSVAAGSVAPVAAAATVTVGASTVSVTPDLTLDRWTLICATATGVVLALPGPPAAPLSTTTPGPVFPTLPTNYVLLAAVYLQAAIAQIYTADIVDKRLFVPRTLTTDAIYNGAGTAALPSYSFTGDTGTGMYRVGAGQAGWSLAGLQQMTLGTTAVATYLPVARLLVNGYLTVNSTNNGTITDSTTWAVINLGSGTDTFSGAAATGGWLGLSTNSNIRINSGAGLALVWGMDLSTNVSNGAGTSTLTEFVGVNFGPTVFKLGSTFTVTSVFGVRVKITSGGGLGNPAITTLDAFNADMGATSAGVTTAHAFHVASTFGSNLSGGTKWAFANDAAISSYMAGALTLGGTGAPTWNVHVQGGNSATNAIGIDKSTTGPTAPGSNASMSVSCYAGSGGTNFYYLISWLDGATQRYKYMLLNGTGTTWTAGTTLPT